MTRNRNVVRLVVTALLCAMVCIATMVIRIGVPGTSGYINIGDTMIFVSSVLFGPAIGGIAGGIGSALGDLLGGYPHWIPFTFVIKGLEGLLVGLIAHKAFRAGNRLGWKTLLGVFLGALWMVLGYFVSSIFMYGLEAAALSVPENLIQGGASLVLSLPLMLALRRLRVE
ncbi:MAG: ECF transporter S component [Clostridiales bacterium]|nr:ECF transporter S component [Clostridiales bacterium]